MERIEQEKATVARMIGLYCRKHHQSQAEFCDQCSQLRDYALERLVRCKYGNGKTACSDCNTHCYRPERREQIRQVMRFAGPRMIWHYPMDVIRKWRG